MLNVDTLVTLMIGLVSHFFSSAFIGFENIGPDKIVFVWYSFCLLGKRNKKRKKVNMSLFFGV